MFHISFPQPPHSLIPLIRQSYKNPTIMLTSTTTPLPAMASSSSSSALQWLSLLGIIWLQSVNGTNTNFPAYSSQLKQILSLSQVQLNNLVVASDVGKLFAWLSGIAADYLPLWLVLLIGTLLGLIGYGFQYLFLTNQVLSLSYTQLFLLCILAGNSICWINTVCYTTVLCNFSATHRAVAVGLSTSYIGLSAKMYTAMADAIFSGKPQSFLLLNSVAPLVVSLISAPLVRELRTDQDQNMEAGYIILFFITFATGIYAVIGSLGFLSNSPTHAIGLAALLATPLLIPAGVVARGGKQWWVRRERRRVFDFTAREVEVPTIGMDPENSGIPADPIALISEKEAAREELSAMLMLRTVEFWLYFFVYMFGATIGLVFLNNLGQIAVSRRNYDISSLVSVSSSFGFLGRLIPSLLDFFFSRSKYMIPRLISIGILMVPMAGAFFMLLNSSHLCLYISTAILGACTGAISSIAVSITSELFGTKNFSVNHNLVVVNIPLGSLLFGYMTAILYDRERGAGNLRCIGTECYRKTFIIWGSFCSLGTFLSILLYFRTRKYYLQ